MENCLHKFIATACVIVLFVSLKTNAQTFEWRLANPTYSNADPDGAGPATGLVTFTLQVHTTGATVNNVNVLATGWSYQSTAAMLPTVPGCSVVSNPANVTVSPAFLAAGFAYTTVDQCVSFSQTTGGQTFDETAVGTLDGTGITLNATWVDVFTATIWTLGTTNPEAGYVIINSSAMGSPGSLSSYSISDNLANEYPVNSLTFDTPLPLGSALPVLFTKFEAGCTNNGAVVSWTTTSESNSKSFELQRSTNGNNWTPIATIKAAGNSAAQRNYQQLDLNGGNAFYRIKQIDLDGHFMYTGIVRTNCDRKNVSVVIYPVPARDLLNVVIKSDKTLKTQLMIIDGLGKIVRRMDASLSNGSNTLLFNLKGLSSGEYMIRSNDASVSVDKKFNIVR